MPVPELSLEEFKARLPLAEIVGRYVKLTRRGREHVGLCPFHKEKTPSFNVVEDKGFYHCFGCGAHGTAIDFVMAVEGLDFGQALERLADLTGLPPPRRTAGAPAEPGQRLYAANAAAAAWFQAQLAGSAGREAAGLSRAARRRPGDGAHVRARLCAQRRAEPAAGARSQGFAEAELLAAGLIKEGEDRRALRPFPPPADVPDRRRARPAWSASAGGRWARRARSI